MLTPICCAINESVPDSIHSPVSNPRSKDWTSAGMIKSGLSLQQLHILPAMHETSNQDRRSQLQKEMLLHPNLTLASALGECISLLAEYAVFA